MNIVEEIRAKINIVDIISPTVALKKHGTEYLGRCPFHGEKSASFFVNPRKGVYYCFGCGVKGNVFDFYMQTNNTSFAETLEIFAQKLNIVLPKNSGINKESADKKQKLLKTLSLANTYFKEQLHLKNNTFALDYLLKRGLSEDIIKIFELGYAKENNNELFEILNANGIFEEDLLEAGLKSYNANGLIYEPFRERIMFPIKNTKGETIAFGGRGLNNDVMPKYLNSKENLVFSKKNSLYGINIANKNLKNNKELIIVEGYMDVITLHKQGFITAVASLGTAISQPHLENIHHYSKNPIFVLDGDNAGKKATERVIDEYLEILKSGLNPKFVFLQEKDPDSFFEKNTIDDFNKVLESSLSISQSLLKLELANKNITLPEVYSAVILNLSFKISNIPDTALKKEILAYFKNELFNIKISSRQKNFKSYQNNIKGLQKDNFVVSLLLGLSVNLRRSVELLYCIYKFPEILLDLEEQLGLIVFESKELNNIKNCLLENIVDIATEINKNTPDIVKYVLLKNNLGNDYNFFVLQLQSKKVSEIIANKIQAKENFINTYNILNLEALNIEINNIDEQIKKLNIKITQLNKLEQDSEIKNLHNIIIKLLKQKEEIKNDIKSINNFINY
jgi:DNA primase catalytic core